MGRVPAARRQVRSGRARETPGAASRGLPAAAHRHTMHAACPVTLRPLPRALQLTRAAATTPTTQRTRVQTTARRRATRCAAGPGPRAGRRVGAALACAPLTGCCGYGGAAAGCCGSRPGPGAPQDGQAAGDEEEEAAAGGEDAMDAGGGPYNHCSLPCADTPPPGPGMGLSDPACVVTPAAAVAAVAAARSLMGRSGPAPSASQPPSPPTSTPQQPPAPPASAAQQMSKARGRQCRPMAHPPRTTARVVRCAAHCGGLGAAAAAAAPASHPPTPAPALSGHHALPPPVPQATTCSWHGRCWRLLA
jgi:hypothetical protein